MILQDEREGQTLDGGVILRRGRGIAGDDVGDGDEQLLPVDGRAISAGRLPASISDRKPTRVN